MTTTFKSLTDEILQTLSGYGLEQPRTTFLAANLTNTGLTATVDDAASAQQGLAEIEDELIDIRSVNRGTNTLTISPDGRGFFSTTAAAHASGTRVRINPTFPRNRVKAAINDVIVGTYPTLFGVAQTQFQFTPSITTYSLPAEAERILAVTADLNGPSQEQQRITHYSFNSVAPTDDWATTNTLTLNQGVTPGRTVTVTYQKAPSALSADSDLLTASGLRETAKLAIVYGVCSQLAASMDVARLPVDTAVADEFAANNQVGIASRVSGQLYLRYQAELDAERKRLRATTPVTVSVRTR